MTSAELALTPRQLQAIIDANGDCIKVLDLNARLLSMNLGGLQVMEIPDFQQCQYNLLTAFWEGEGRAQLDAALDAARAGETRSFEGAARTFAGTPKWWSMTVSPLRDDHGHITHLLSTSRDITARKQAEAAQAAAQAQLAQHAQTLEQQVQAQTRALEERTAALDAFVSFTEAVGTETDTHRLAAQAVTAVQAQLRDVSVAYYELDADMAVWRGVVWSEDVSPDVVAQMQGGVPLDAPAFAETVQRGEPVFIEGWDAEGNALSEATMYGAAGFIPLLIGTEPRGIFAVGKRGAESWPERDQAIVRAVARGLGLSLERAAQAGQLRQQRDDLNRRTQELETLLELTEDLGEMPDPVALVARAQMLVLRLLPPGFAAYYEVQEGRWQLRAQTGESGSAVLQAQMEAGFPVGQTPSFDQIAQTGRPAFVDSYDPATDIDPEVAQSVAAHATLPLLIGGQVRGLFNVPLFDSRAWTLADQAILLTTVRHLGAVLERVERQVQLVRSNAELQAANQELEAFTYSVSHDLRTPVRHVEGFSALARRELTRQDPVRAERHLDIVTDAAGRMNMLLDAMLTLSRAGRAVLNHQAVPLGTLVDQAVNDVTLAFPDRPVAWTIGPLPIVQGDAATLQQVVRHLLENAVKYSQQEEAIQVQVWVEDREQEWAVLVRDNGVGFDPQYASKLFGAFQRLHTQQEFPGTGIGLATVKRIVTRHGGRVWAESTLGEGATFGFSLPKTAPPPAR